MTTNSNQKRTKTGKQMQKHKYNFHYQS